MDIAPLAIRGTGYAPEAVLPFQLSILRRNWALTSTCPCRCVDLMRWGGRGGHSVPLYPPGKPCPCLAPAPCRMAAGGQSLASQGEAVGSQVLGVCAQCYEEENGKTKHLEICFLFTVLPSCSVLEEQSQKNRKRKGFSC